jgi:hypothetical protein
MKGKKGEIRKRLVVLISSDDVTVDYSSGLTLILLLLSYYNNEEKTQEQGGGLSLSCRVFLLLTSRFVSLTVVSRKTLGKFFAAPTWLILPVVICLSQRLSHACLSTCRPKVKPQMAH